MFMMNNVFRSLNRTKPYKILLVSHKNEATIKNLCTLDHSFYLWNPTEQHLVWLDGQPENLTVINGELDPLDYDYFDFIICFDRLDGIQAMAGISGRFHIPMITYDLMPVHRPILDTAFSKRQLNIGPNEIFQRCGFMAIAVDEEVSKSYRGTTLYTVGLAPISEVKNKPESNDVIYNNNVDKEFIELMNNKLMINPKGLYGKDHNPYKTASIYLNVMNRIDEETLTAMKIGIPVISMQLEGLVNGENALIFSNDTELKELLKGNFDRDHIINNAKEFVKDNSIENFKEKWEKVFAYASVQSYTR